MKTIKNLLICPRCSSSDMELKDNTPYCKNCGYTISESPLNDKGWVVKPFYKPFSSAWELTKGNAVNRSFMNACIKELVSLNGLVLDMGSGKKPRYLKHLRKKPTPFQYIKADGNPQNQPDIILNFEDDYPIKNASFDNILLFNVLEHIYDYKPVLRRINRILKPDGSFYLYVPYFIKIHGSPLDFHRYTHFTLFRALNEAGFTNVEIYTDGGLFKPLSELLSWLSSIGIGYLLYPFHLLLCLVDALLGKLSGGKYLSDYPTGYFAVCRK
jgi:SAM-dependent methyltransferase